MKFGLLGWNYRATPIETREQLNFPEVKRLSLGEELRAHCEITELVLLSTCNRSELYFAASDPVHAKDKILQYLCNHLHNPHLPQTHYFDYDLGAVKHLFRVASSLDSMIKGESQILGQVKDFYQKAQESQWTGTLFKGIFPKAFSAAKRVRNETQIAQFAVSISFAAVELAKRIFNDLEEQTVLVVGAGEMAELAAKHFIKNGVSNLLITNRTFANATVLAEQYKGSALHIDQLGASLEIADIVIASTGASHFVISEEMVRHSMKRRKGRPLFLIDIAMPRDIDPAVNDLSEVYLYDIDDLQNVVDDNKKEREHQAELAEILIQEEVDKVGHWFKSLTAVPTLRSLRESFQALGDEELNKALQQLGGISNEQKQVVEKLVHSLVNKLLHKPTLNLKHISNLDEAVYYFELVNRLFELSPLSFTVEDNPQARPHLKLLSKRNV